MKKTLDSIDHKEKSIKVSEAKDILNKFIFVTRKTEFIEIRNCVNRISSQNIISKNNVPKYNNAAVDGYALNFDDLKADIREFELVGCSRPGEPFNGKLEKGQAIKIFTGAIILPKFRNKINVVFMRESCCQIKNKIKINEFFFKGQNIRKRGEDIKNGEIILEKGRKIRVVDLGFLSSLGLKTLKVYKKLNVGIFSTGDEIITKKGESSKNKIFDSNMLTLLSMVESLGCNPIEFGVIGDDYNESKKKIFESLKLCDVLITTGGISSSETDHIKTFILKNGKLKFSKILMKPGRPFSFAVVKNKPLLGLPGNPVAVVVVFLMFVVNYISKMSGLQSKKINYSYLPSSFDLKKKKNRKEWLRGSIIIKNKKIMLTKFKNEGSGILSSVFTTQGIIELDEKTEYIKKGDLLKFYRYEDILN